MRKIQRQVICIGDRGPEIPPGRKLLFAYFWLFRTLDRDELAKMTYFWCFLELPTGTKGAERDEPVAYGSLGPRKWSFGPSKVVFWTRNYMDLSWISIATNVLLHFSQENVRRSKRTTGFHFGSSLEYTSMIPGTSESF